MSSFSGRPNDLNELIAYERDALALVRLELFDQRSSSGDGLEMDLSKPKTAEGHYPVTAKIVGRATFSGNAVKSALSRLRPLAFSAAFKMHDMIVEWVLRANGSTSWRFVDKISDLRKFLAAGSLAQPRVLDNWPSGAIGFWRIYEVLAPFRNQLTHGGSFVIEGDVLKIRDRSGALLMLSDAAQGAYARFICLVADHALNGQQFDVREALIAENDLYELRTVHALTNFSAGGFRFTSVQVSAPTTLDRGLARVVVNFDDIRASAERVLPVPGGGVLAYDLTLTAHVDGRRVEWWFPDLDAPTGEVAILEGDPQFEIYRIM